MLGMRPSPIATFTGASLSRRSESPASRSLFSLAAAQERLVGSFGLLAAETERPFSFANLPEKVSLPVALTPPHAAGETTIAIRLCGPPGLIGLLRVDQLAPLVTA
jgi:hypothetical protein